MIDGTAASAEAAEVPAAAASDTPDGTDIEARLRGIGEFGEFWRARHELRITDVRLSGKTLEIQLSQPAEEIYPWTGLALPGAERYEEVRVLDAAGLELKYEERMEGGKLFMHIY